MYKRLLSALCAHDATVIGFGAFLSILIVIFHRDIPQWLALVLVNSAVSLAIVFLAYYDQRISNRILTFLHHWYLAPLIFLTYKELYLVIHPLRGGDYDGLLIAIDRWLFGVDPTVWIARFASPVITEILQIAYSSFYFLLIVVGYGLYKERRSDFLYYVFLVVYGFYLSYIGYLLLPAVGPRFTLHNFDTLNDELPGVLLTNALRDFVNIGESIPLGVPNPIDHAQRDVFPSGHAMMMLVMMHVVVRYRMKVKWFILITGILMIIGTVYLRYHYVVDLVAGGLFYGLCMWSAPGMSGWWETVRSQWKDKLPHS